VPERCAWITFALCASVLGVWLSSWLTVARHAQGTLRLLGVLWAAVRLLRVCSDARLGAQFLDAHGKEVVGLHIVFGAA
jgi:hypothetical protein